MGEIIEIAQNFYINFKHEMKKDQSESSKKEVSAIIMGSSGVGKTCLFNHLCNKSEMSGISNKRLTQQTVSAQCRYYPDNIFKIYDTPGLEKKNEDKCFILRRTLKYIPFNLVLIMCKLQTRFEDSTITEMKKYSELFAQQQKLEKKLVFIVSFVDILAQCQDKNEVLIDFVECLKQNQIQEPVILFSNQNENFQELANILYVLGVQKDRRKVQYDEGYLCNTMQLTDFEQKSEMKQRLDQYQNPESQQLLKIINQKSWLEKQLTKIQKQEKQVKQKSGWKFSWNVYDIFKNWLGKSSYVTADRQYSQNDSTEDSINQYQTRTQIKEQKEQQEKQTPSEIISTIVTDEQKDQNNQNQSLNQSKISENQIQKGYQYDPYLYI